MKRLLFLLVIITCLYSAAFAKSDTAKAVLTGTALVPSGTLNVSGVRYNSGAYIALNDRSYWVEHTYGLVKLSMPAASQTASGTASVTVNVSYTIESGGNFLPVTETGVILTVSVSPEQDKATDAAYYLAKGAHAISVTVTNVTSTLTGLSLSTSVITESFDYMLFSDTPAGLVHSTVLTAGGSLPVSWAAVGKAEAYELEWTYISNQAADELAVLPFSAITIPPYYFRTNSSRVEVSSTSYNIPLVYEKGYILYRVRAVGKNIVNSMPVWVKSNWTYADNGTTLYPEANAYLYAGLENNINWQSSLSFAEEGKHKVVVSYHDGSSRNRQAVTRINTDGRAIVGETFYDYNGRPMIQTLPVPVKKDSLGFYPHFNVVDGQPVMRKEDAVSVTRDACNPTGPKLSTTSGASNYYSPDNTFGTTGNAGDNIINKELIPDAKKYPYSQMVYTPDNTGRIATQSGMGEANHLGSDHETSYLYATPLQTELCRLFGTQVGYAAHYKKNTVIDPNGQVSVSYLDLDGKVVATALAGGSPENVTTLGNDNTRAIREDVLATNPMSNAISADSTARIFNKKFVVTSNNTPYSFEYKGEFGYYDIPCNVNGRFTSIDGVVDVYMTLTDKCGVVKFSAPPMKTEAGNSGIRKSVESGVISKTLDQGEYVLTKKAVINEDKLSAYTQDYLASTCAKQLDDFMDEERAKIDLTDCNLTCQTCIAERDTLMKNRRLTAEQKEDIKNMCAKICDENFGCSASLNAMKGDMSPMGQYAEIRLSRVQTPQSNEMTMGPDGSVTFSNMSNTVVNKSNKEDANPVQPQLFPLSIFNAANRLPLGSYLSELFDSLETKEYWRYPIKIKKGTTEHPKNYQILNDPANPITLTGVTYTISEYLDVNGDTAFVYVRKKIAAGNTVTYEPAITNSSKLKLVDGSIGLYRIPVRYLANIVDFEKAWKNHWAYNLLPYHPEFPYYIACMAEAASNNFDYALMNTTFENATAQGYITDGVPSVYAKEGTMNGHLNTPGYAAWMDFNINTNYQKQNSTLAVFSNRMTNCVGKPASSACGIPAPVCDKAKITTEAEWLTYRSLYLSLKQTFIKTADMIKAVDNNYYNGCIGHSNYIGSKDSWYFSTPKKQEVTGTTRSCSRFLVWKLRCENRQYTYTTYTMPYLMQSQVCFAGNADYFKKKSQRFYPTQDDDANAQQAGNCPKVSYDAVGKPLLELVPCTEDIKAQLKEQLSDAERMKYELCGLCPLASDVESLLIKLTANNKLLSPNTTVTCDADNIYLGSALKQLIVANDSLNSAVYWSGSISTDKKTITGSLKLKDSNVHTITLVIPATVNYTFDEMLSMCCLSVSGTNNSSFKMRASFKQDGIYQDVWLNGVINLDLKNCIILPKCVLTEDATNAANFLNILSAKGHLYPGPSVNLFEGIADESGNNYTSNVYSYFDAVLSLLRITNENAVNPAVINNINPVWTSTAGTNIVSGELSYKLNGVDYAILIEVKTNGSASNSILSVDSGQQINLSGQFKTLKPKEYTVDCTNCEQVFTASFITVTNNSFSVQPVIISVPLLVPIKCSVVIPGTVDRIIQDSATAGQN